MWIIENDGSKFQMQMLTELQIRGVKDLYIASIDGLNNFYEAINTIFSKTKIQHCIVHMVRKTLKYISYKDYKAINVIKKYT